MLGRSWYIIMSNEKKCNAKVIIMAQNNIGANIYYDISRQIVSHPHTPKEKSI
jgi:hypothetical protein